jgi:hypothetical protein
MFCKYKTQKIIYGCKTVPSARGITGPPCPWGIKIREPGPPGWGSLIWDSKIRLRVVYDSDHWETALQTADRSSRRRGKKFQTGSNIWSQVPQLARHQDILTDWPSIVVWLWLWHSVSEVPSYASERVLSELERSNRVQSLLCKPDTWNCVPPCRSH